MKQVPLTKGQLAFVDDADYEWAMQFHWHASWSKQTQSYYAKRNIHLPDGEWTRLYMHRELLGLDRGDKRRADHEDRDTVNNQRSNLRIATPSQNAMNRIGNRNSSSPYKGVAIDRRDGRWIAQIKINRKNYYLGRFDAPQEAAAAYRIAAERMFGEFAYIETIAKETNTL